MKQLESGGCCLARQSGAATLPSKAERIMARFRPIAPRPAAQISTNCPSALELSNSSLSTESFGLRLEADSVKPRRTRKRRVDSDARSYKRSNSTNLDLIRCSTNSIVDASFFRGINSGNIRFPIGIGDPVQRGIIAPDLVQGNGSRGDTYVDTAWNTTSELSQASDISTAGCKMILGEGFEACSYRKVEGGAVHKTIHDDSYGMLKRDEAFMARAAASALPTVLPEGKNGGRSNINANFGEGFTDMIRAISSFPCDSERQAIVHSNVTDANRGCLVKVEAKEIFSSSNSQGKSGVVAASNEVGEVTNLVTLPLLPDTPSHADFVEGSSFSTSSAVGTTKANLGSVSEQQIDVENQPSKFSLFGDELGIIPVNGLGFKLNCHNSSFLDQVYVEQVHCKSPDPVLLVDDSRRVLWFNKAYDQAVNAIGERRSCKAANRQPYIDPLGIPIVLDTFSLRSPRKQGSSIATLWGFLKRPVVGEFDGWKEETDTVPLPGWVKHLGDSTLFPLEQLLLSNREQSTSRDREDASKYGVIMPRPKRLVGSTVSLESVTEVHSHTDPLCDDLGIIEAQLEENSMPALISSWSHRVRWVNTAYKRMVGQPECPWLASTVRNGSSSSTADGSSPTVLQSSPGPNGEVSLICGSDKIPESASVFSGRVNIQWENLGQRCSMTVPCDVSRLQGGGEKSGWRILLWKFDVAASLRLNCGW